MTIDTDCTEPAPSAPDIAEQIAYIEQLNYKAVDYMQSDTCKVTAAILRSLRELASARSRIAELESRQPQSAELREALDAAATTLEERGAVGIYKDGKTYSRIRCVEMAQLIRRALLPKESA